MADEFTAITTAVISVVSALAGVGVQWMLGNITTESQSRRTERQASRQRLQEGYIRILADTDFYLRSVPKGGINNERLSMISATVDMLAGPEVNSKFQNLEKAIEDLLREIDGKKALVDYQKTHLTFWVEITTARKNLVGAMRTEIESLLNFPH